MVGNVAPRLKLDSAEQFWPHFLEKYAKEDTTFIINIMIIMVMIIIIIIDGIIVPKRQINGFSAPEKNSR